MSTAVALLTACGDAWQVVLGSAVLLAADGGEFSHVGVNDDLAFFLHPSRSQAHAGLNLDVAYTWFDLPLVPGDYLLPGP